MSISLRKECPYLELLWSAFSRIRTEYGEIQSECGKMRTRVTPNTDTFHEVYYAIISVTILFYHYYYE